MQKYKENKNKPNFDLLLTKLQMVANTKSKN